MEKRNDLTGQRIESRQVRPLLPVAVRAAKGQIVLLRRSTMLLGKNVIDLKRLRNPPLQQHAIFATPPRSATNQFHQLTIHFAPMPLKSSPSTTPAPWIAELR